MLIDPFKRKISYVRVSVTDRCDFRCTYCMSEDMEFLPKKDVLSLEELERLCNTFIDLGVKKLRITGGEPLVRKNIIHLFKSLGKPLGKQLFSVPAADARTASLGSPPAGYTRFCGMPIENHWEPLCFLQPRPDRALSGPGPLRRNLRKMIVIRKPFKTIVKTNNFRK